MMRNLLRITGSLVCLYGHVLLASTCSGLAKLHFAQTTITAVALFPGGRFVPPDGTKALEGLPAFCRVQATLKPSEDSAIRVEVWLPVSGWNERFEGAGSGGFAGNFAWGSLGGGVVRGYAVANTDMGLETPPGKDASIFVGHPERWVDWGYRSTHEMTVFGKALVKAFYARDAKKNYFTGCSTGGQQALMEAQRFPEDYDGIIGGAPAQNRTALHEGILWNFMAVEASAASWLPAGKVALLSDAVVKACDELDGVRDGVLADPRQCGFDPGVLLCDEANAPDCLTAAQVDAVRKVYAGPSDPRTGKHLYPGLMRGSEFGWNTLGAAPAAAGAERLRAPFSPMFEWAFGADWDWRTFDFDQDALKLDSKLAGVLNATSADLDAFRGRGGKLLLYHGWADPLIAPEETIRYFDALTSRDASSNGKALNLLDDSVRLFMMPGVAHCTGGPGPSAFDPITAMEAWVEKDVAPERLIAVHTGIDGLRQHVVTQRPLCSYPQQARYDGKGDAQLAASFVCSMATSPQSLPQ